MLRYLLALNAHNATRLAYAERLYLAYEFDPVVVVKMLRAYLREQREDYYNRYVAYSLHYPHVYLLSSALTTEGVTYRHAPRKEHAHERSWTAIMQQESMYRA